MESAILDVPTARGKMLRFPPAVVIVVHEDSSEAQEYLWVLHLDDANQLLHKERVHIGTVARSLVRLREHLRKAVTNGATEIITIRAPANGNAQLVLEDIQLWRTLEIACESQGIAFLDHLVVSASGAHISCRQTIRTPFKKEVDGYKTKQGRQT